MVNRDMSSEEYESACLSADMGIGPELDLPERTVETVTLEIRTLHQQAQSMMLGYAIEIGRRLAEVKAMLPHGAWGDYLRNEVAYSQSTAQNFMKIFEEYGADQQSLFGPVPKSQTLGNLPYTKALVLLALPSEEREDFIENHDVCDMSTRELKEAIRQREEALADKKAAEQARDKMAEDMRTANARLAQAKSDSESAAERETALRAELEELQKRPVEVPGAAVPDAAALEAARVEGATELQEKLTKAKEAKAKSDEKRKAAEAELEAVNRKLEDMERQDKKAAIVADKDSATYAVLFEQGKELGNKMRGLLLKARAREDKTMSQMMERSLTALGTAIMEAAK